MEQRTPEWHESRRGRVTASSVGAILGNSPHTTRDAVMRRMVRDWHGAEREFVGNIATDFGTYHEAGALVDYQMETGNAVETVGFITRDEWAGCSPDGLISLTGGIEIKCPFSKRKMTADDEFKTLSQQPHYYDQIQFSLWVTQRATWDFWQWSPGTDGMSRHALETATPDSKWRAKNLPKLKSFWDEFCEERQQDRAQKHLEPLRVEIDTLEAKRILTEYDELSDAIDNATARKAELLANMVILAGNRNATICGRNLTLTKRSGSISYAKALKDIAPDADLEPYRGKPSESWGLK